MSFANPLPWWAFTLVGAALVFVAWRVYRRVDVPPLRRYGLVTLRSVTLIFIVVILMRPVARSTQADAGDAIVPILVDTSRSMGIEDADRARRIDRAREIVAGRLLPALGPRFQVELLGFGEGLTALAPGELTATQRRSDLAAALTGVRERYRGRAVAGIVLLSDGGDTGGATDVAAAAGPPVFPLGIGAAEISRDREILSVTAVEAVLDDSRVDLAVTAVSHDVKPEPIELRLLENGRPIEVRRVTPAAENTPVREVFKVSPGAGTPTVYSVEVPRFDDELVPENNVRSVLVQPPARKRRVLLVEGAPGYEHSFLKRAWAVDPGLEVDSVVRKGRNEQGRDTFYIQAVRSRSQALEAGYPTRIEDLFHYDALVLANVVGHQLTRRQLDMTRAFVARRGGGLLVLGARSFLQQGLLDTPVEEVLPLDLTDRGGAGVPSAEARGLNRVSVTSAGEAHPMMQLAPALEESRKRWEAVPALASIAPLGGPRPGATVLAVTSGPGGAPRALAAVQRFGEGRAMAFTGEAAWRWRMMLPAADRSYDTFWRQAVRWLALPASDPIDVSAPPGPVPGETVPLQVMVRDDAFEPLRDVEVEARIMMPDGRLERLPARPDRESAGSGRFVAGFRPEQAGVYRVIAEVRRGTTLLGSASTHFLVGGADPEMSDPRLNERVLQRIASASGGRVITADQGAALTRELEALVPMAALSVRRDLWHTAWCFGALLALLGAEWILRRVWGLR
ncbi:MAG TPA: hypothetical protein VLD67_19235 [Vicinamibacterales bacterium]|nr:hypothetical protein [Vicinamibacterales bacterium]